MTNDLQKKTEPEEQYCEEALQQSTEQGYSSGDTESEGQTLEEVQEWGRKFRQYLLDHREDLKLKN